MSKKLTTFVGAAIGLVVAVLFILMGLESWFVDVLCIGLGAIIGYFCGKRIQKNKEKESAALREADKKKNQKRAEELHEVANTVQRACEKNEEAGRALVVPTFKANAQMDEILKELANATELMGKIDAMANDTKTKGGASR